MLLRECREPFPLLADPVHYTPDTLDIWGDRSEMLYWLTVLQDQVQTVVEKAAASDAAPGAPHFTRAVALLTDKDRRCYRVFC